MTFSFHGGISTSSSPEASSSKLDSSSAIAPSDASGHKAHNRFETAEVIFSSRQLLASATGARAHPTVAARPLGTTTLRSLLTDQYPLPCNVTCELRRF